MGTGGPSALNTPTVIKYSTNWEVCQYRMRKNFGIRLKVMHLQGLEPWTHWLRVSCSTNWARGASSKGSWNVHWKAEQERHNNTLDLNLCSSSPRSISIGQLNTLLCLHLRPIKLVVYEWPYQLSCGISNLEVGFTLRCFQRLSHPYAATQLCHWHDNWCTGGTSDPVLSY